MEPVPVRGGRFAQLIRHVHLHHVALVHDERRPPEARIVIAVRLRHLAAADLFGPRRKRQVERLAGNGVRDPERVVGGRCRQRGHHHHTGGSRARAVAVHRRHRAGIKRAVRQPGNQERARSARCGLRLRTGRARGCVAGDRSIGGRGKRQNRRCIAGRGRKAGGRGGRARRSAPGHRQKQRLQRGRRGLNGGIARGRHHRRHHIELIQPHQARRKALIRHVRRHAADRHGERAGQSRRAARHFSRHGGPVHGSEPHPIQDQRFARHRRGSRHARHHPIPHKRARRRMHRHHVLFAIHAERRRREKPGLLRFHRQRRGGALLTRITHHHGRGARGYAVRHLEIDLRWAHITDVPSHPANRYRHAVQHCGRRCTREISRCPRPRCPRQIRPVNLNPRTRRGNAGKAAKTAGRDDVINGRGCRGGKHSRRQ